MARSVDSPATGFRRLLECEAAVARATNREDLARVTIPELRERLRASEGQLRAAGVEDLRAWQAEGSEEARALGRTIARIAVVSAIRYDAPRLSNRVANRELGAAGLDRALGVIQSGRFIPDLLQTQANAMPGPFKEAFLEGGREEGLRVIEELGTTISDTRAALAPSVATDERPKRPARKALKEVCRAARSLEIGDDAWSVSSRLGSFSERHWPTQRLAEERTAIEKALRVRIRRLQNQREEASLLAEVSTTLEMEARRSLSGAAETVSSLGRMPSALREASYAEWSLSDLVELHEEARSKADRSDDRSFEERLASLTEEVPAWGRRNGAVAAYRMLERELEDVVDNLQAAVGAKNGQALIESTRRVLLDVERRPLRADPVAARVEALDELGIGDVFQAYFVVGFDVAAKDIKAGVSKALDALDDDRGSPNRSAAASLITLVKEIGSRIPYPDGEVSYEMGIPVIRPVDLQLGVSAERLAIANAVKKIETAIELRSEALGRPVKINDGDDLHDVTEPARAYEAVIQRLACLDESNRQAVLGLSKPGPTRDVQRPTGFGMTSGF